MSQMPQRRRKGPFEYARLCGKKKVMRLFVLACAFSLATLEAASAQTANSETGRFSFSPVSDGVLRLDTRTGQISHCSPSDAGWVCKVIPDERSALESEIARLQAESATLRKELLAHGPPAPGAPSLSPVTPSEPALRLPTDADVDKMISFIDKFWRRVIEMVTTVQKDAEKKN